MFAFDPAHNILSDDLNAIPDNRLKIYNGTTYYYDDLGNLIHRELADGEVQNYFYDLHDQLVKSEIFKKDGTKETWAYTYDALGRRIGKGRLKNEEVSDGLEEETGFVWDGSHLLQEIHSVGRYTYIYADPDSYEPLAQIRNWTTEDGENRQQTHYFHCDQIGIPREMTDKDGNLLWFGNYTGWGRLKEETKVTDSAYQPFRLQNQYADRETGLHYNFFRYYEPDAGRFVNQDPIGLMGGSNFYNYSPNVQAWVDLYGLSSGCNDGDEKDSKLINQKELKRILDKIGTDPHAFKADYVGKRAVSHYDVYKQNKTGELLLRRKNSSEFIRTGIGCDDDLPPPTAPETKCSSTQAKKRSDNKNYWYIAGLAVVAAVAIVSPLDGPFGDAAALGALGSALSQ